MQNVSAKFQKVMDQVLAGFGFPKCYIDDNLTLGDHLHDLQEVFGKLK
jgi:hypothetical protein